MFGALREMSMDVSVEGVLETEHGLQEREKDRDIWCLARIKGVRIWI